MRKQPMTEEEMEAELERSNPKAIRKALSALAGKTAEEKLAGIKEAVLLVGEVMKDDYFGEDHEAEEYMEAFVRGFSAMFPEDKPEKKEPKGEKVNFRIIGNPYRIYTEDGCRCHCYLAFAQLGGVTSTEFQLCILVSEYLDEKDEVRDTLVEWHEDHEDNNPGGHKGPLCTGVVKSWMTSSMAYRQDAVPFAVISCVKALDPLPFTEKQMALLKSTGKGPREFLSDFAEKVVTSMYAKQG